jgi:hypothetical protein
MRQPTVTRSSAEALVKLVQVATMAIAAGRWHVLSSWLVEHADELETAYVRSNQPLPPEFREALRELDAQVTGPCRCTLVDDVIERV